MRIGKRLFPYPTINNSKIASCFKNSNYSLEYDDESDNENLVLKNAHIQIDNDELIKLIVDKKAEAVVIIECSSTIFRTVKSISIEPKDIIIPLHNLRGKVEISSFIYAKEEFEYSNDDFLDDYEGYSFTIEKYDILAIDDGFTTKIEYNESEDKKLSSIFRVIKSTDPELKVMKVDSGDKFIKIVLPEKEFGYYDNLKNRDYFKNIFFSIIAIPSLIKCLQEFKNERVDIDYIRLNHSWFDSIMVAYKKNYNEELTDEIFADMPVEEISQTLLNYATVSSIEDISNLFIKNMMIGGMEEDE